LVHKIIPPADIEERHRPAYDKNDNGGDYDRKDESCFAFHVSLGTFALRYWATIKIHSPALPPVSFRRRRSYRDICQGAALGRDHPFPSHKSPFHLVDPQRFMALLFLCCASAGLRAAFTGRPKLCASSLLSRGFKDQVRDFVGMGDQREMAGLHLDGLGAHPLGHEALKVRIDRAVFR
jgi:hypothetical protein